jgi:hypothetical protein
VTTQPTETNWDEARDIWAAEWGQAPSTPPAAPVSKDGSDNGSGASSRTALPLSVVPSAPEKGAGVATATATVAKPFVEQYIDVPRDILDVWRNGSRFAQLQHLKDDPKTRQSGAGLVGAAPVSRSWLYAAIARCADNENEEGLAIVRPEAIAAGSGISLRTLQAEFAYGNKHCLSPFITRVFRSNPNKHWRNDKDQIVWKFEVVLGDKRNSLHTRPWWLWQEPEPEATGPERLRRRVDAEGKPLWDPNSPALIVCWAIAHVGKKFRTTDRHGITGLSTLTGLSPRAVQTGHRDAVNWGMLTRDGGPGGTKAGRNSLRFHPSDPMGALPTGETDHLF